MILHSAQQAHTAITELYRELKPHLLAGRRYELSVRDERRSGAENALLHAMLTHISRTQEWAGKKHDPEVWKRLLTAAWCRARGEPVEILPALDGHGVDIVFRKTSKLTVKECAELIEYVSSWGAQNDVRFPADPKLIAHDNL